MSTVELQPTVAVQVDGHVVQRFHVECELRQLCHEHFDSWGAAPDLVASDIGRPLIGTYRSGYMSLAIWEAGGGLALLTVSSGKLNVSACGATPLAAAECLELVRERLPAYESGDDGVIPVMFWTASQNGGGRSKRREIDAPSWGSIHGNYPVAEGLAALVGPDFRPGVGGQLILWHGEPGTGKTTALRALAREWRAWCDLHYIVDPEAFFGSRADYMMDVMTEESLEMVKVMGGGIGRIPRSDVDPLVARWRLLVFEDCGEMLAPDAKREVGQALARLLNACDGLIGRGLRVMALLTTNEPAEKLHEAVARPGRCAARVEFRPFTGSEARDWLADHDCDEPVKIPATLADLYAALNGWRSQRRERAIGFAA